MTTPVCPNTLPATSSAEQVWRALAEADSLTALLTTAHEMWCGPRCDHSLACTFLHCPRSVPPRSPARAVRPRYTATPPSCSA